MVFPRSSRNKEKSTVINIIQSNVITKDIEVHSKVGIGNDVNCIANKVARQYRRVLAIMV